MRLLKSALTVLGAFLIPGKVLLAPAPLSAETPPQAEVRAEMGDVYDSFRRLWELSIHEDDFLSGKNDKEISGLLKKLDTSFHSEDLKESKFAKEPTYRFLLQSIGRMIEDARYRFDEGKRGYGLWKVKNFSNYCITCHLRLEGAAFDFVGDEKLLAKVKDPMERAQYLLASRRFEKAAEAFMKIAEHSSVPYEREQALAKWLMIEIRVLADPNGAIAQLAKYSSRKGHSPKEQSELELWQNGLKEWQAEGGKTSTLEVAALLKKAAQKEDSIIGGGVIEYLRATAILHEELEKSLPAKDESEKLYQLAQAYAELPGFFRYELPEMFLERSIRLQPNSDIARQSFKLYERLVLGAYSGSGGTHLPDDVKLHTKDLENLAYGVVDVTGRV